MFDDLIVPKDWKILSVNELVELEIIEKPLDGNHGGIHPKSSDYVEQGIPFIMASDLVDGEVDLVGCKKITVEQSKTLKKGFAKSGDVLLSHKATIGRTAIVQNNNFDYILLTPQVTYYRVKNFDALSPKYLKAYFDSPKFQALFKAWAGDGSTRAYLGITAQQKLPIVIPPLEVQRQIVDSIGNIERKILLNKQMNQTLEKIAQRIFKSWFIDFDPVKANAEGVPFDGLSPEIQSLFPSEFVESEMGLIPKGWDVKPLDSIGEFLNGLACQKYPPRDEADALPVIKIAEMKNGYTQKTNQASKSVDSKYLIQDGDFLFSWSGSLTTCYWALGEAVLNQHLFKVSPLSGFTQHFVASWVNHHLSEFIRIAADKATTMGHIKREHLSQAKVVVPNSDVLDAFDNATQPLINRVKQNQTQSEKLKKIRGRLLPKLLSGSIEINQELMKAS